MRTKLILLVLFLQFGYLQSNSQSSISINYGHLRTGKAPDFGNSFEFEYAVGYEKFIYPSFELSLLSMQKSVMNSEELVNHLYLGSFIGVNKLIMLNSFSIQLTGKIGLFSLMAYDEDEIENSGSLTGNKYYPEKILYTLKTGVLFGYAVSDKLSIRVGAQYNMPFSEYFMYELNGGILLNLK